MPLDLPAAPGLEWLAGHKMAYAQPLPNGKSIIGIELAGGILLSAELPINSSDKAANIPMYRHLGDFLGLFHGAIRPGKMASASR